MADSKPPSAVSCQLTIWVCAACGKTAASKTEMRDSSCMTHAVECYATSVERSTDGRARRAKAVERGET